MFTIKKFYSKKSYQKFVHLVNMNKNYHYPTTIWESTLNQIYVFPVLFTCLFLFTMKNLEAKILPEICTLFNDNTVPYCSFVLFDLFLYVPSTIFQLYRDRSSWVEPVQS